MKYLLRYYKNEWCKFKGLFASPRLAFDALDLYLQKKNEKFDQVGSDDVILLKLETHAWKAYESAMAKPAQPPQGFTTTQCKEFAKNQKIKKDYDDIVPTQYCEMSGISG